jgi:hypothetical protein
VDAVSQQSGLFEGRPSQELRKIPRSDPERGATRARNVPSSGDFSAEVPRLEMFLARVQHICMYVLRTYIEKVTPRVVHEIVLEINVNAEMR